MAKTIKDLDKSALTYSDYTDNTDVSINTDYSTKIGALSNLQTSNKDNLVEAINELFQNVDSGKQLIADAIDEDSITKNSTFEAMSDAIKDKRDRLYSLLSNNGYEVDNNTTFDNMMDLLESSGIRNDEIKKIVCGRMYTMLLKKDGTLWGCGYNSSGQLGFNDTEERHSFVQVTLNISNDVEDVICGESTTYVLKKDGTLWGCGANGAGQLGLNNKTHQTTGFKQITKNISNIKKVSSGSTHTVILKNDGSIWGSGTDGNGQLGGIGTVTTFTKITSNISNDVKDLFCIYNRTFVIKNDGSVWSCGYNGYKAVGVGSSSTNITTFTKVASVTDAKQIAGGDRFTLLLKNDGTLWGCGNNGYGAYGVTTTSDQSSFVQVTNNISADVKQIACGYYHSYILKNDGSIWSCGLNGAGQLGWGTTGTGTNNTFTKVTTNMNKDVDQIICANNYNFTFVIKNDKSLWGVGDNTYGQLGTANVVSRTTFVKIR